MAKTNASKKMTVFTYGRGRDLYSHVRDGWLDDRDLSAEAQKIASAFVDTIPTVLKAEMFRGCVLIKSQNLI